MKKQYVERVKIEEKAILINESKIATRFHRSLQGSKTISLLFKEQRQKRVMMGFLYCHVTSYEVPIGHALFLRGIIIHCSPKPITFAYGQIPSGNV